MLTENIVQGILLPFWGTTLGAACVFFLRGTLGAGVRRVLMGFAAGIMTAASIWSLLLPAIEQSGAYGRLAFLPATVGFWSGILFLVLLDRVAVGLHGDGERVMGSVSGTNRMVFALILHNIPEGMAVGAVFAGCLDGSILLLEALSLALGIGIQNFPEGAIISLPLRAEGMGRGRAFWWGVFSGAVEPVAAVLTMVAARLLVPLLPLFLGFAAGAMIHVVVNELIPDMNTESDTGFGTLAFAAGFSVMMALDVSLG